MHYSEGISTHLSCPRRSFATRCLTNSNVSFSTKLETIDFFYYICTYMVYVVCLDIFNYSRILIFFKINYPKNNIVITLVWNFIIYPLHICTFTSIPHHLKKLQFSVKNIQDQRFKMDKTFFFW